MQVSGFSRVAAVLAVLAGVSQPAIGQGQDDAIPLVPEKRVVMVADTDLPGGDLAQIFDVTLESCIKACLANEDCQSFTYNQRSRACFPKGDVTTAEDFLGALSGRIIGAGAVAGTARARADQAGFLRSGDLQDALQLARAAATRWTPRKDPDPRSMAWQAEVQERWGDGIAAIGPVVAGSDLPADWITLARLANGDDNRALAASAAINGYLRSDENAMAATALHELTRAWDDDSRGRDGLAAIRHAATLSDDPKIAEALQRTEDRYGMRVVDHEVEADQARPKLCVNFSYDLSETIDYAPYLRMPEGDLTAEAQGRMICITGMRHGSTVDLTLRAGLPSVEGEVLARDVELSAYVRDRSPQIRFPGRAYVLPATGDRGIEVVTVNADTMDLRLLQVSDRNLVASMRSDLFARPLDRWSVGWLDDEMATEVWTGKADAAGADGDPADRLNNEVTTRLGIPDAAGPLAPGVYVLQASLPDADMYDDDEQAAQWFMVSDLGISSLWGSDALTVVVRGLSDAGPREGIEVALVSRANAVLATETTDADGVARFDAAIARGTNAAAPAMVSAIRYQGEGDTREAIDMSFLSLLDAEFDLSDRGVAGMPAPGPIDLFMTTDRGVYRAGETAHVTAMARDSSVRALQDLPLSVVFTRPDGVDAIRQRIQPDAAGGYVVDLPIDGSAPRGTWRLEMRAGETGPPLASTRVLVEDFLPERVDFSIDLPQRNLGAGEDVTVSGDAKWLFGTPAADLPFEAWLRLAPVHSLPEFPRYDFGLPDSATPQMETIADGTTDDDGNFTFAHGLDPDIGLVEATYRVQVSEGAGRPVERSQTRIVVPDSPLVGIKQGFEANTVSEGTDAAFEIIAIDADLDRIGMHARWVLTRLESEYVWYRAGDRWDWEVVTHRQRVDGGDIDIAADTPAKLAVPTRWGQYELRVEPAQDDPSAMQQGAAAVTFWAGWAMADSGSESPDRLTVRLDRQAYRAGDEAVLTIEAEEDGIAIVSVLTNHVIDLKTVDVSAGANTVNIPVTDEWGAGAYVTAASIRPLEGGEAGANRAPVRRLGLAYAPVDPGPRRLDARIEVAAQSRPRGDLPVTLQLDGVAPGQTAFATIAVVDQGILNLTGFASPDPAGHYFGQRRLGVGLRDLYGRLLMSTGAADGALREGGDAGGIEVSAPPPTEVLMAYFSGPLTVGDDGAVTVDVPVPDFNGEVRIMAVAWTDEGIGQAEATALIRDPVVMVVTAPQFMAPGDSSQLQLDLTRTEAADGQTGLSVEAAPAYLTLDAAGLPDTLELAEDETRRLILPVSVPANAAPGVGKVQLALTEPDGSLLTKDISIPIMDGTPEVVRRTRITLTPGVPVTLDGNVTRDLRDVSRITMAAGPFASLDVASVLGALWRYPYGCTEQIASTALPMLYMPKLAHIVIPEHDATDDRFNPATTIDDAVTRILSRQDSEGAFGMWSAESGSDFWLDAYTTDFLSQARTAGHAVPEQAWQMALDNLRNAVNYATNPRSADRWENSNLAYASLVLARERAAAVGDLRYYVDAAGDKFDTPLSAAQLGAALALYGDRARADTMMQHAFVHLDRTSDRLDDRIRWDYGSNLRDRAAVLALAVDSGLAPENLTERVRGIAQMIDQRRQRGWGLSTQDSAALLRLASALADAPPALRVDGEMVDDVIIALFSDRGVTIEAEGRETDVTLTAFGRADTAEPAGGLGYAITRNYYDMDGMRVDTGQVSLGERLTVLIEVTPFDNNPGGGRLIIDDPLPAGFEIDNPNLIESGADAGREFGDTADPDMAQFRQDRFIASTVWQGDKTMRLVYMVRAVHPGRFNHPPAVVEDMYRPEYRAWTDAGTVEITP